jgi:hypothetical protein
MWHFTEIAERGISAAAHQRRLRALPEHYRNELASYATIVVGELDAFLFSVDRTENFNPSRDAEEAAYQRLKADLLAGASSGTLSTDALSAALEMLDDLHVALRFVERASRRMMGVAAVVRASGADDDTRGETAAEQPAA